MKAARAIAAAVVLANAGCAFEPLVWTHATAGPVDLERDVAQCRYEATAATASYSTGPTARTRSGAIAQGFGEGLTRSMRGAELLNLCLRARGWYQVRQSAFVYPAGPPAPLPTEPVPRVRSEYTHPLPPSVEPGLPAVPDVVTAPRSRDNQRGRWAYAAERVAVFYFPSCETPRALLTHSNVKTEFFEVACAGPGMPIPIQCDYADCSLQ